MAAGSAGWQGSAGRSMVQRVGSGAAGTAAAAGTGSGEGREGGRVDWIWGRARVVGGRFCERASERAERASSWDRLGGGGGKEWCQVRCWCGEFGLSGREGAARLRARVAWGALGGRWEVQRALEGRLGSGLVSVSNFRGTSLIIIATSLLFQISTILGSESELHARIGTGEERKGLVEPRD